MAFHPDGNLPDCMMPDGGDCCAGHAAVCGDWHKQRQQIDALTSGLKAAVRAANLALFVINKHGVMPNHSWEGGFKDDLATAEAALMLVQNNARGDS